MQSRFEMLEPRRMLAAAALDLTFGDQGRAELPFNRGRIVGVQLDGKLIVRPFDTVTHGFRLTPSGQIDPNVAPHAYGSGIFDGDFEINPLDGRIVIGEDSDYYVSVYHADGASVNSAGSVFFPVGSPFVGVEWQGEKFLIAYSDAQHNVHVVRHNADGSRDLSFGTSGELFVDPSGEVFMFETDSAGRIYIGVQEKLDNPGSTLAVADALRFTADGDVDSTYGGDGSVRITTSEGIQHENDTVDAHLAPDGSLYHLITLGGEGDPTGMRVTALNAAGATILSQDLSLSSPASSHYIGDWNVRFVRPQGDGNIFLLGSRPRGTSLATWRVMRLTSSGTIDRTYGNDGTLDIDNIAIEHARSHDVPHVLSDGALLLGGRQLQFAQDPRFPPPEKNYEVLRILPDEAPAPTVTLNRKGTLVVTASDANEDALLRIRERDDRLILRINNFVQSFAPSKVKRIGLFLQGGTDTLTIEPGVRGVYAEGGDGNDTLRGGQGDDVFIGGAGADELFGIDGNDKLIGEGGNDYLLGGAGKDDLFGNGGSDILSGAGGNDRLFGGPDAADRILGGAGNDSASDDAKDSYQDIETLLA